MPFSNHQFSLRCLFSWEVPQIDCCQCLSRDQYRFMAILKNDTEKRKKKKNSDALFAAHPHISIFFHFFLFATLFDAWKFHFLGPRNIPTKSLVMRNSLLLSRVTGVATPNSCLGKSQKKPATFTAEIWPIRAKVTGD